MYSFYLSPVCKCVRMVTWHKNASPPQGIIDASFCISAVQMTSGCPFPPLHIQYRNAGLVYCEQVWVKPGLASRCCWAPPAVETRTLIKVNYSSPCLLLCLILVPLAQFTFVSMAVLIFQNKRRPGRGLPKRLPFLWWWSETWPAACRFVPAPGFCLSASLHINCFSKTGFVFSSCALYLKVSGWRCQEFVFMINSWDK